MSDITHLQVQGITAEKLLQHFEDLKDEIHELKNSISSKRQEEYLTKIDVAKLLKVHPNTVDTYTEKGVIKKYKIYGKRVLYKRSEVEASLTHLK
ncbi:MAG: helix-turn-helix domain-containing protein [Zunongwangia sp.]|uniref:helix-turn-helix domain-containing protein n=1 Tax=Zunongwangia sp. TaxID=1965325 RepID=UPI003241C09B